VRQIIHAEITTRTTIAFSRLGTRSVDLPREEPEPEAQEEELERRLVDPRVEEDRRRIDGEQHPGERTAARGDEAARRAREKHACESSRDRLDRAHARDAASEDRVDRGQEVRVQRSLVVHLAPEPIPRGDALGPRVVTASVPQEQVTEHGVLDRDEMEQSEREGESEEGDIPAPCGPWLCHVKVFAHWFDPTWLRRPSR
jgi:hypothetical protein